MARQACTQYQPEAKSIADACAWCDRPKAEHQPRPVADLGMVPRPCPGCGTLTSGRRCAACAGTR